MLLKLVWSWGARCSSLWVQVSLVRISTGCRSVRSAPIRGHRCLRAESVPSDVGWCANVTVLLGLVRWLVYRVAPRALDHESPDVVVGGFAGLGVGVTPCRWGWCVVVIAMLVFSHVRCVAIVCPRVSRVSVVPRISCVSLPLRGATSFGRSPKSPCLPLSPSIPVLPH